MIRLMKVVAIMAIAVFDALAVSQESPAPVPKPQPSAATLPFSLKIEPLAEMVRAGSEVAVKMTFTNLTKEPLLVEIWGPGLFWQFDVRDKGGNKPLTERGRDLFGVPSTPNPGGKKKIVEFPVGSSSAQLVEPGKTLITVQTVPPELFDLTQPGKYTIQASRPCGLNCTVKSNTVIVTITP